MKQVKYEKPMLVKLGFDSSVLGVNCQNGTTNPPQCKAGATARINCNLGSSFALPNVCSAGPTPAS